MSRPIGPLLRQHGRSLALLMALGAAGVVLLAVVMTRLLALEPCHLCIFQRVINFAIAVALMVACGAWWRASLRSGALALGALCAAGGMAVAGHQSWLQWFPETSFGCGGGQPGIIEQLVEWLGQQSPVLFLATGFCESKELVILNLSLANWSFLTYAALLAGSTALLISNRNERKSS
jgi:disulfide bond formation protein DsbB